MYLDGRLLFLYAESPLHAGSGTGLGAVDLPIQRERTTGYPIIQASGVKGALRSEATLNHADKTIAVFGPDPGGDLGHAGALSPGDAHILLFPVRSLRGVFAWTTSLDVLARFQRHALHVGINNFPTLPASEPAKDRAYVSGNTVRTGNSVVLEEFAFAVTEAPEGADAQTQQIARWLAENVLPPANEAPEYNYWRTKLPNSLVILPNDAFRDFVQHATEVITRIRLDNDNKTVVSGALWTQEHLPTDSILYTPILATRLRMDQADKPAEWRTLGSPEAEARAVLDWASNAGNIPHRMQIGGDETVGRGLVRLRWRGGRA